MYAFHRRINKHEHIVGWYATTSGGAYLTTTSYLIHDYYSSIKECKNPVHIVVDTTLAGDNVDIRGFVSRPMKVGVGNLFDDIPVNLQFSDSEAACLHHMINCQGSSEWASSDIVATVKSTIHSLLFYFKNVFDWIYFTIATFDSTHSVSSCRYFIWSCVTLGSFWTGPCFQRNGKTDGKFERLAGKRLCQD